MKSVALCILAVLSCTACSSAESTNPAVPSNEPPTSAATVVPTDLREEAPAPTSPTRPTLTLEDVPIDRYAAALAMADRTALATYFEFVGYTPPAGAEIIAARLVPLAGEIGVEWFSYGETGFARSDLELSSETEGFWPASAVKAAAAIAALETLAEAGADAGSVLTFDDPYGGWTGPASELIHDAIVPSDNGAYNRLMLIAGLDAFHERTFPEAAGYRHLVFQRFYVKPSPELNLRESPAIAWVSGSKKKGTIAARSAKGDYSRCPKEGNCTTLYELVDIMIRLTNAEELPESRRFAIHARDREVLLSAVSEAPSRFSVSAAEVFGHNDVTVYNKAGRYRGDDDLDHAVIVDHRSGQRYAIAAAVPHPGTPAGDAVTEPALAEIGAHVLRFLGTETRGSILAFDHGEPFELDANAVEAVIFGATEDSLHSAGQGSPEDSLTVDVTVIDPAGTRLDPAPPPGEVLGAMDGATESRFAGNEPWWLVGIARRNRQIVGYRLRAVRIGIGE